MSSLLVARNNTFVGVSPSLPPTMSGAVHRSESYQEDLGGPQSPQNLKEVRAVMPRVPTRTSHAFTIEVELNQKKTVSALLDSGATADFIDARLVAELRLKKYQLDTIGEIYLASEGVKVSVSTEVTLDLNCHGVKVRRGFFVYPQLTEPLVFGTPFMIDFAKFLNLSAQEFNGLPLNKRRPQVLSQVKRKSITHIDATRLERHCKSRDNEVFTLLVKLIEYRPGILPNSVDPTLFNLAEFADVVTDHLPEGLPPSDVIQHSIEVIPGHEPPHRSPYRLSLEDKKELTQQIDQLLQDGKIEPCGSPYGAPVIFVKKKDGTKRLCVDYRALNNITVRERFPLPLIDDIFDALAGSKVFSSVDLLSGYHQVKIADQDVYKTAFVTPFGQYAWRVMPFGLTNAPSTFQHLMNQIFHPILQKFVVVYLDDILIYSKTPEEHAQHLSIVLNILRENRLIAKASKCFFFQTELRFLGHILRPTGIFPDPDKIKTIQNWTAIKSIKQAQSFLGLCGFYRRFIHNYSKYTACIHDYIAGKLPWTALHQQMFDQLRERLTSPPILILPHPDNTFVLYTDASGYYMGAVLNQVDADNKLQGVVAYESRKFKGAELNYDVREKEFLAIIHALKKWRHYLLGKPFILYTDHHSLQYVLTQKTPTGRIARWMDVLAEYSFEIRYIQGPKNVVADCLSRKEIDAPPGKIQILPDTGQFLRLDRLIWTSTEIGPDPAHLVQLQTEYRQDPHFSKIYRILLQEELLVPPELEVQLLRYTVVDNLLYYAITTADPLRLCIPQGLTRRTLLHNVHASNAGGHRGVQKTYALLVPHFYWFRLFRTVKAFVAQCDICQQNKTSSRVTVGLLRPLPVPTQRWQDISMDFVSGFGKTASGFDNILVVVDRLTKMAHLIPTTLTLESDKCAQLLLRHVFSLHGFPLTIVSDQDKLFRKQVWGAYMKLWGVETRFAVKNHPQTDGQSERTIRTISDITRTIINTPGQVFQWDVLLPMVEFAYNNTVHSAINTTPFFANYGFHPRFFATLPEPFLAEKNAKRVAAHVFALDQQTVLHQVRDRMAETQLVMSRDANRHRTSLTFSLGDLVLVHRDLLIVALIAGRKFTKLWLGPVKVTKVVNNNAYELDLPLTLRSAKQGKVFNVTSLKEFIPLSSEFETLPPMLIAAMAEQSFNLTSISEVTNSSLVTHWLHSDLPVRISILEYEQLPFDKRLALENDYNTRVLPSSAFHSNPGSFVVARREVPSGHSTLPRTSRLRGLHDPPRVRGRTQL